MDNLKNNSNPTWCTIYPDRDCTEDNCCMKNTNERPTIILIEYYEDKPSVE